MCEQVKREREVTLSKRGFGGQFLGLLSVISIWWSWIDNGD